MEAFMKELCIRVKAITPICHSNFAAALDYRNPIGEQLKQVMAKRKPTVADHEKIEDLSWQLNLYQRNGKPLALGRWIRAGLISVARFEKKGKHFERAIVCVDDAELVLSEEKTLEELSVDSKYRWTRPVSRGVLATNPIFPDCSFETVIVFDETEVNEKDVIRFLNKMRIGASIRMGYGRVEVEILNGVK
jgi:hypothetical protein